MSTSQQNLERLALSVPEAARTCGISRATVYRLIQQKKLETVKLGARRLVRPEALIALLNGGAQ
jgi:excisionase family DNA binding protein